MKSLVKIKALMSHLLMGLLGRVYSKPEGQRLLFNSMPYSKEVNFKVFTDRVSNHASPYQSDLCVAGRKDVVNNGDVIFVTGRFRSGSTLLWNIFRDIPETTSYYEPFNERQWFNPDKRGEGVDGTHVGVDEYWKEYDGLNSLGRFFKESWGEKKLYMTASTWEPQMMRYIDELIRAADKRVVLQFNRLDFRLDWIRQYYPNAKIIHIYRSPREQWLSYIKSAEKCRPTDTFSSLGNQDFFYLRRWGRDLRYVFPFLDEELLNHPYELFYLIWRLSYNHGVTYADYSIAMDDLSKNTESSIIKIFSLVNIDPGFVGRAVSKVKDTPAKNWRDYAKEDWFDSLEERGEATLEEYYFCKNMQIN